LGGAGPAWSPDGLSIAYYYHREYSSSEWILPRDFYTIDPHIVGIGNVLQRVDGTQDTALTSGPEMETQPAWSPDSQWLVFTSNRDRASDDLTQAMDLWVMDRNGQNIRRIYNGEFDCMTPVFHRTACASLFAWAIPSVP
jgi:Tol biopolymer transport system component